MNENTFPKLLFLAMLAYGAHLYFDLGKPGSDDIKPLVLKTLRSPLGAEVTTITVGRSFQWHRPPDASAVRAWPVSASVSVGNAFSTKRRFFLWRDSGGAWTAEIDPLTQMLPWDKPNQADLSHTLPKL